MNTMPESPLTALAILPACDLSEVLDRVVPDLPGPAAGRDADDVQLLHLRETE
jgi:hypothetical protein